MKYYKMDPGSGKLNFQKKIHNNITHKTTSLKMNDDGSYDYIGSRVGANLQRSRVQSL